MKFSGRRLCVCLGHTNTVLQNIGTEYMDFWKYLQSQTHTFAYTQYTTPLNYSKINPFTKILSYTKRILRRQVGSFLFTMLFLLIRLRTHYLYCCFPGERYNILLYVRLLCLWLREFFFCVEWSVLLCGDISLHTLNYGYEIVYTHSCAKRKFAYFY